MKRKNISRLNVKIISIILLSAVLVSLMTAVVLYNSFSESMAEIVGMEYETGFNQMLAHIDSIYEEAVKYAQQIAISESAQDFLAEGKGLSVTEQIKRKRDMLNLMSGMVILSNGIDSMAIVKEGETPVWTALPFMDEESLKMCREWYDGFRGQLYYNDDGYGISSPYEFSFRNNNGLQNMKLVSICIPIYSMKQANACIGELVVNVDMETVQKMILNGETGFDFVVYRHGDTVLMGTGQTEEELWREDCPKTSESGFPLYYCKESRLGGRLSGIVNRPEPLQFIELLTTKMLPVLLMVLCMIVFLLVPVLLYMMKPVKRLAEAMQRVGEGKLETRVDIRTGDEFETLGYELNRMAGQLEKYLRDTLQGEKDRHELEYEVLVAQINPHFIYNTLNTVIYLTKKQQNEDVVRITKALIDLLQDGIRLSDNRNFSTVEEEIWIIQNYVCIQNYRYRDKFEVRIDCPEELKKCCVPSSVIQPLVENAIFHGIVPLERKGTIDIRIRTERRESEEKLVICIADDGVGISEQKRKQLLSGSLQPTDDSRNHVGLQNVLKRLSLLYERKQEFYIFAGEKGGTVMEMAFPVRQNDKTQAKNE